MQNFSMSHRTAGGKTHNVILEGINRECNCCSESHHTYLRETTVEVNVPWLTLGTGLICSSVTVWIRVSHHI